VSPASASVGQRRPASTGAIGEFLDPSRDLADGVSMRRTTLAATIDHTIDRLDVTTRTTVRAPQLLCVARALLALDEDPDDRRARISLALLRKEGASDCPMCERSFEIPDVRITRTPYDERCVLSCDGCRTRFVVDEQHVA
jgi:hypothetical protein